MMREDYIAQGHECIQTLRTTAGEYKKVYRQIQNCLANGLTLIELGSSELELEILRKAYLKRDSISYLHWMRTQAHDRIALIESVITEGRPVSEIATSWDDFSTATCDEALKEGISLKELEISEDDWLAMRRLAFLARAKASYAALRKTEGIYTWHFEKIRYAIQEGIPIGEIGLTLSEINLWNRAYLIKDGKAALAQLRQKKGSDVEILLIRRALNQGVSPSQIGISTEEMSQFTDT